MSETLILGEEVFTQPEVMLEAAFTQLAFNKIDMEQQYEFFHESNIALNEVLRIQERFSSRKITS